MPEECSIPKIYNPETVEQKWYNYWQEHGLFKPAGDESTPVYCITIPPPNVTGSLHIGHALCYSIHDVLLRWKRMQGYQVLCVPGTDHAGIATQNVVEKNLRAQGLSRHDLGREKFLEEVWKWVDHSGGTILKQFRRLGCSFEWDRTRFTMDEGYVHAIHECFIKWWEDGLIYRGTRITNWCPRCLTAISDIEVEHLDAPGKLYRLRYPFADGNGYVVVATTRPETMLGDTAVAVNPADPRYADRIGALIQLPLTGRQIPLITDEHARMEFGTGAVKITPAHDPNDYEVGKRHELPVVVVIDEQGVMTAEAGEAYAGLDRYDARKRVLADLEAQGLLDGEEDYTVPTATCARCHTVIEPRISDQWYVRMDRLAQQAIEVVREGRVRFVPDRYTRLYIEWMENIKDWCISRQLWWGHRIPVWYTDDGEMIAASDEQEALAKSGGRAVRQDDDVLDTWFSSALWPHAVLGWPQDTDDLEKYYPTSVLITARDILYLWVARMIMTGVYFKQDVPFRDVYIYSTVLTEDGRRMSKSLGTGVDPLDLIDMYGSDALRMALLIRMATGQDLRFAQVRDGRHSMTEEARNFCNKLWNASRYVLMNLDDDFRSGWDGQLPEIGERSVEDRWILSRLNATTEAVNAALTAYNMDDACRAIYQFFWDEYCDWYIEATKPRLYGEQAGRNVALRVLCWVLDRVLRLLHPFMPFITEEIWQAMPRAEGDPISIMIAHFPEAQDALNDPAAESTMMQCIELVRSLRALRSEIGLDLGVKAPISIHPLDQDANDKLHALWPVLKTLARVEPAQLVSAPPAVTRCVSGHAQLADLYLVLDGLDMTREVARLTREAENTQKELDKLQARLNNPKFTERAPAEVIARDRQAAAEVAERLQRIQQRLESIA